MWINIFYLIQVLSVTLIVDELKEIKTYRVLLHDNYYETMTVIYQIIPNIIKIICNSIDVNLLKFVCLLEFYGKLYKIRIYKKLELSYSTFIYFSDEIYVKSSRYPSILIINY